MSETESNQNHALSPEAATETPVELSTEEQLQQRIDALEAELTTAKEDVLRAAAEAQNARRRAEQEADKSRKFALEKFASELLAVVDNLERALTAIDDPAQREGIELTSKSLLDTMARFGVAVVDPQGEAFNPELHQAIAMLDVPHAAPDSVVEVMQKGYTLNGRLLRAAMVAVAKKAG